MRGAVGHIAVGATCPKTGCKGREGEGGHERGSGGVAKGFL